jgi:flagellar protein FlaH
MTNEKVISTGNSEIDKKMGGGIPIGSLTLIEGQSSAGKSVLAQQIIWGSLNNRCKVTLFTTENTVKSLVKQMESLNLDILDFLLLGRLNVYPVQVTKAKEGMGELLQVLLHAIEREKNRDLILIDSLTSFVVHAPIEEEIAFFEGCKDLCDRGLTMFNVVHSYAFSESSLIRIRAMCDAHLRLRIEEIGDRLVKILEVAKIRGADKTTGNIVSFDVEPGWGMRIIPIVKAKA